MSLHSSDVSMSYNVLNVLPMTSYPKTKKNIVERYSKICLLTPPMTFHYIEIHMRKTEKLIVGVKLMRKSN